MLDTEYYKGLGLNLERESRKIYLDSPMNFLVEQTLKRGEGHLSKHGALVVSTGKHTGRSAKDKYIVQSSKTKKTIWWDNTLNAMTPENFAKLKEAAISHLNEDADLFITERALGAHQDHNIGVRVVTHHPQHALFSKYLFRYRIRPLDERDFTVLHVPDMKIDPEEFGTRSGTVIATCFDSNITIIVGTLYAGEIKKSMFCVMNYLLPEAGVLPMHTGANKLQNGDTALFFGLSGTGKTTLSTDQGTLLIGDDEHGMNDDGIFNFEGGCYAKTLRLSRQGEPEIWHATNSFGAMIENVVLTDKTGEPDFFDDSLTENGRSSYPLDFIEGREPSSQGKIPGHIFFLSADAFGILPPVAKLNKMQAMFYFVAGYTAKVAGTEIGVKEPKATFSPCFGGPFMMRHPEVYADLLGKYLDKFPINVWLINTGWSGGGYGVGNRLPLNITRNIIRTVQTNALNIAPTRQNPIFGFDVPVAVRNVPTSLLNPRETWDDKEAFDAKAKELASALHTHMKTFDKFYKRCLEGSPLYGRE